MDAALLVAGVDDVAGAGGLLQDSDLVLALAGVVVVHGGGDGLELVVALGVVNLEGAFLCQWLALYHGRKARAVANSLLDKVEGDGKVLPGVLLDGGGPDLLVLTVEDLEGILGEAGLAKDGATLEVELVGGVVRGLVPDVLNGASVSQHTPF